MGHAAPKLPMTAEEFLAWDADQPMRHEFVRGEVFAMAGAEERHVMVAGNIYSALRAHLRGTPCRTFISDMKLRVREADAYFYPDVMVTCSPADAQAPMTKSEPLLLADVLSPSTASFDRGDKFAAYRSLPTLQEYLMVDIAGRRCELSRRDDKGLWVLHPFAADQAVALASVGLTIEPATLWADVDPPPST
jgi:Uma2 family endonuclease